MLNGCHQRAQQQTSAKPAEKPEENGEKQEMKDPETSDEKIEKDNQEHESNPEPSGKPDDKEPEAKDEPIVTAVEASNPVSAARITTKVMVNEDLEKVQIQIDFSGFQFKPEHSDV